jgi:T-complex protein 1 subunit theta
MKPALATKRFGSENILAALIAEAVFAVMPTREKEFCVDDVRCVAFLLFFLWCVGMRS